MPIFLCSVSTKKLSTKVEHSHGSRKKSHFLPTFPNFFRLGSYNATSEHTGAAKDVTAIHMLDSSWITVQTLVMPNDDLVVGRPMRMVEVLRG